MFDNLILFAQEGTPPPAPGGAASAPGGGQPDGGIFGMIWPILLILPIFYLLIIRPNQRAESERKKLLSNLKKGDEVLTNAGIYGTVVSVSENEDEAVVKIDEGTRIKLLKSCIVRNLSGEKAAKEEQDKK